MIREMSDRLLKQLEQEMEEISSQFNDPLEKLKAVLEPIRLALKKLKKLVDENPFKSNAEEIRFFKYTKPEFYSWRIYHVELYTIEKGIPYGDAERQRIYFEQEMRYVERFFTQHQFHYEYYKMNVEEMDNLYFVRGAEAKSMLLSNIPDLDPSFSTGTDYLFAKMKAFEKLRNWLNERIAYLQKNPLVAYSHGTETGELRWTGESINLAEVAVAMHNTKQVNNGSASIGSIFRWLEEKFQINIGIPSKRISEIRRRTKFSRTRYLDEMKDSILTKFDKEDEYDPDKLKTNK